LIDEWLEVIEAISSDKTIRLEISFKLRRKKQEINLYV